MFQNYLTNTFRHLRRYKLFTTLNVLGLAISISACWLIYRLVAYEFSYDKNLADANIYRVVSGFIFDEKESYNGGVSAPLYQALRKEAVGLQRVVPVMGMWEKSVSVNGHDGKLISIDEQKGVAETDSSYFGMVSYQWLAGNARTALMAPNQVVLTESRAKQYFPDEKPEQILSRQITYISYNDTIIRTVSGVVADQKGPTEFTAKELCSLPVKAYELNEWTNTNGSDKLYLQLEKNAIPSHVLATIQQLVDTKSKEFQQQSKNTFKFKRWFELLPLSESHFSTYINEYGIHKANKKVLHGLLGVAAFLLLLACINYINMGMASIPQRSKEIGVRKTLGSTRTSLIGQFLAETFVTSLLASGLAFLLGWAEFGLLKNMLPEGLTPSTGILLPVAFALTVSVLVTLLSGVYPAWLITQVKTVDVFRRVFVLSKSGGRIGLQKALIVFQFAIAIVFITGAMIVGSQLHYMVDSDMGFNKDAVVLVDIPYKYFENPLYKNKQFTLVNELKTIPGIKDVSLGQPPLSTSYSSSQYNFYKEGKDPVNRQVFRKKVDTSYLRMYGFQLLAGRNLHESDTTNELVINETAVKAFGFASPQEALGKMLGQTEKTAIPIVGVVRDFHTEDFYNAIDPAALMSDKDDLSTLNIKLDNTHAGNWQETLKAIQQKWYAIYPPESFSYKFYDDSIADMYKDEHNLSLLINLATGISIFISCLGLLGLSVLTAYQRTKEIGIRKVLGASVAGIVTLLSRDYLRLIGVAILIATPVAWWATDKWMRGFAYRMPLHWWLFAVAGISALTIGFLTVGFNALKAASANPVKSLRTE